MAPGEHDPTAAREDVVTDAVRTARRELMRHGATDPTYGELMATYSELGALLNSGRSDVIDDEHECGVLAYRLVELGKVWQGETEQRWAIWCAQNMTDPGRRCL